MFDHSFKDHDAQHIINVDAWKVLRIVSELINGFEVLPELGPSVSIFGSSRSTPDSPYYNLSVEVAKKLAQKGFAILTGGNTGLMEAANQGACQLNGVACELRIKLPHEHNQFAFGQRYVYNFHYFFVRKVMFVRYAQGFVVLPGGLGTLDELFEALTLIQTKKISPFPVYLMGTDYWKGLIDWLKDRVLREKHMAPEDLSIFRLTDDPDEVANGIDAHYRERRVTENF
jgi:uncharacterized protein (TIGR00730 family)